MNEENKEVTRKKRKYKKRSKPVAKNDLATVIQDYVNAAIDLKTSETIRKLKRATAQIGKVALDNKKAVKELKDIAGIQ